MDQSTYSSFSTLKEVLSINLRKKYPEKCSKVGKVIMRNVSSLKRLSECVSKKKEGEIVFECASAS